MWAWVCLGASGEHYSGYPIWAPSKSPLTLTLLVLRSVLYECSLWFWLSDSEEDVSRACRKMFCHACDRSLCLSTLCQGSLNCELGHLRFSVSSFHVHKNGRWDLSIPLFFILYYCICILNPLSGFIPFTMPEHLENRAAVNRLQWCGTLCILMKHGRTRIIKINRVLLFGAESGLVLAGLRLHCSKTKLTF